jgi:hypothetical protein
MEVTDKLGTVKTDIDGTGQAFDGKITAAADALKQAASELGKKVGDQSTDLETKIGQLSGKLDNVADRLERVWKLSNLLIFNRGVNSRIILSY